MEPRKVATMDVPGVSDAGESRQRALVQRAAAGDADAFAEIIERRASRLLRTAAAILGSAAEAHDVVQETLVSAWVHLPQLRDADRLDAWLNRTLRNACSLSLRRRRPSVQLEPETSGFSAPDHAGASLESASIRAAFGRLSVDDRQILLLHHLHHLPLAEVARQLGTPVGTAKSRLWRARQALERALEAER
jgi:RNA polymerase sigma-70 factor (ECF subfamily)